jgi:DNA polymerase III alpha subunit (gram-positive type)
MAMTHIMVDCETTGVDPARAGVIQLSAMKFDLENLVTGAYFDGCPAPLRTRRWEEGTRKFWRVDNKEVFADIVGRQQPARAVFQAFADFCCKDAPFGGYTFVAKPLKFDWPMIESQMLELDIEFPFAHHNYLDMHSYIAGLRGAIGRTTIEDEVPFPANGKKHNSLHDVAWQIDCLFHAKRGHVLAEVVA